MGEFVLYSDGGSDSSGRAGSGCIVETSDRSKVWRYVAPLGKATNNEAEILAGLVGLSAIRAISDSVDSGAPPTPIAVRWVADSEYVLKSATAYIRNWQRNGWKTADKKPVKNQGLWRAYLSLSEGLAITPEHVRGHTGHTENEACDSACAWARGVGELAFANLDAGSLVPASEDEGSDFWTLVDARRFLEALRAGRDDIELHLSLCQQLAGSVSSPLERTAAVSKPARGRAPNGKRPQEREDLLRLLRSAHKGFLELEAGEPFTVAFDELLRKFNII